jgi:hypothetical protein
VASALRVDLITPGISPWAGINRRRPSHSTRKPRKRRKPLRSSNRTAVRSAGRATAGRARDKCVECKKFSDYYDTFVSAVSAQGGIDRVQVPVVQAAVIA